MTRRASWCRPSSAATKRSRCRSPSRALPAVARARKPPCSRRTPDKQTMIEAVKFWNEPNNKSHWDPELDPDWAKYAEMVKLASAAVRAEAPGLTQVLGGISPIDANF